MTQVFAFFARIHDPCAHSGCAAPDRPMNPPHDRPLSATRRRLLRALAVLPAATLLGAAPLRALATGERRSLRLISTHTGESLTADFHADGGYRADSLAALDHLLRDHRTGDVAPMDPRLYDLLHDLAAQAGREPCYEVISGYRSPQTNAVLNARSRGVARHSLHMDGRAIDVRLAGFATDRLRDLALAAQVGGVGYYRSSDFIHLDTGRVRTWAG